MTAFGLVAISWLTLIICLNSLRWRLTTPSALTLCLVAVLSIARPTLLVLGLDTPFPNTSFENRSVVAIIVWTQLAVLVWMVTFTVATNLTASRGRRTTTLTRMPGNERVARLIVPLAVLAVLVTIPFWLKYGGFGGLTGAAKSRTLGGTARLARIPAILTAYLGAAVAGFRHPDTRRRLWARRGWAAYAAGAAMSYSWGARDAVVFPLVIPFVMAMSSPRRLTWTTVRRFIASAPRVATAGALVLGLGLGLRMWRDVTLTGGVQRTLAEQTVARQVSVGMNLTQFDAMMLVMADAPQRMPRAGATAIRESAASMFPAAVSDSATAFVPPAVRVAKFYDARRNNGWPLTAVGDWYYALGFLGVLLGAMLSGFVMARFDGWQRRQAAGCSIASVTVVVIWSTTLAPGGISLTTPTRVTAIGLPVALMFVAMRFVPLRLAGGKGTVSRRELPPPIAWRRIAASAERFSAMRDLGVTMLSNVAGLAAGLGIAVVATRHLGRTEFGALSWATTAVYLGAAVAAYGLPLTVVALRKDDETAPALHRSAVVLAGLLGTGLGALLFAATYAVPGLLGREFVSEARVAALAIAPTAVLSVLSSSFRAEGRFVAAAASSDQTVRIAWLVGVLGAVAAASRSAVTVSWVAAVLLLAWAVAAFVKLGAKPTAEQRMPLAFLSVASRPFFLGTLGATMIPQAGVLALGALRGADEVATFSVAVRVQMLCSLVAAATTRVIGPRIARWQGTEEGLSAVMRDASTFVFLSTAACALPFLLAGRWTIPLLFGGGFRNSLVPTALLLGGLLVNAFTGSAGQLLYNSGHQAYLAARVLGGGVVFVVSGAVLGKFFGATGVAATAAVVLTVLNIWQAYSAFRLTGIRTWAWIHPRTAVRACQRFLTEGAAHGRT